MKTPQFEHVPADGGSPFRYMHKRSEDLSREHAWHFHPEYELSWVMSSHGTRYVGDYIQPYGPGELVLYGPNLPHCSRNDVGAGEMVEHVTIQFDPNCMGDDFFEIPEASSLKRILAEASGALMFEAPALECVGPMLLGLGQVSGLTRLLRLMEILDRLSGFKRRTLTTSAYRNEVVVDRRLVGRLNAVQRYIDERFRGTICQAEIARTLGMSAPAFSKFVRAATGNTFMGLVKLARINEACRQLAYGDERITDVALDCGYQHTSHFDRHFMALKGLSPSDYRRRMQLLDTETEAAA